VGGKYEFVHRLVLLAFKGPCPRGREACHKNGNGLDNRIKNLKWGTRSENRIHGLIQRGSGKLTMKDVMAIRASGPEESFYSLGKKYEVCEKTIQNIVNRVSWRFLPDLQADWL